MTFFAKTLQQLHQQTQLRQKKLYLLQGSKRQKKLFPFLGLLNWMNGETTQKESF